MKQIRLIALVVAVLMFGALSFVSADEGDNACSGGVLDGKCGSDWEWICGYYLQQWTEAGGWSGNYAFPDWCDPDSVLPRKPEVSATGVVSLAGCYTDGSESYYYTGTRTTEFLHDYDSPNCNSATGHMHEGSWIETASESEAEAICETLVDYPYVWNPSQEGFNSPANLWICDND